MKNTLRAASTAIFAVITGSVYAATPLVINDGETIVADALTDTDVTINGNATLRLTADRPIDDTSSIDIASPQATLILEALTCSETEALLPHIKCLGKPFDASADRLSIYGNGSQITADALSSPLTIYSEPNCKGNMLVCEPDIYYRGTLLGEDSYLPEVTLGDFDNAIRSFRLRRGFACTLANNADGTGYSRVFIADDADIIIDEMPEGLEFASFVRVMRHDRVGKRGICGLEVTPLTRSAWFYDWGAGGLSSADYQYVPMRHNQWWDSWENIGSRTDTDNLLGYNEPDLGDQADVGPDYAISQWPLYCMSGLRLGSPAPASIDKQWLKRFIATADSLNYRVDFVATHMYWDSQTPENLCRKIEDLCTNDYNGRPMWITEWNNGANWTKESWPDQSGPQRDADFNIIYDTDGNTTEVARPHTPDNSAKQTVWLRQMLPAFDNCKWLERHALYNWVEDARALVIDGKLTPAGRLFAAFKSAPAYRADAQHIHLWRIAPPFPTIKYNGQRVRIDFFDNNGETAKSYTIERRINGVGWHYLATLYAGIDYKVGKNAHFLDYENFGGIQEYRIKATSYKDTESIYSRAVRVNLPAGINDTNTAPEITITRISPTSFAVSGALPGSKIDIYAIDGRCIASAIADDDGEATSPELPRGLYIVLHTKVKL